jgi:hypothetical protein
VDANWESSPNPTVAAVAVIDVDVSVPLTVRPWAHSSSGGAANNLEHRERFPMCTAGAARDGRTVHNTGRMHWPTGKGERNESIYDDGFADWRGIRDSRRRGAHRRRRTGRGITRTKRRHALRQRGCREPQQLPAGDQGRLPDAAGRRRRLSRPRQRRQLPRWPRPGRDELPPPRRRRQWLSR